MADELCRKLTAELGKGITTEAQVVYLMAGIRKLIERDDVADKYDTLNFHCNWALHAKLDREAATIILHLFDSAEGQKREGGDYEELSPLKGEIDRISKMERFKDQMRSFLEQYQLPPMTLDGRDRWTHFLHLYTQVIQDTPLQIRPRRPTRMRDSTGHGPPDTLSEHRQQRRHAPKEPIKHITHIVVKCELANAPIEVEDDGRKEMLYNIWWTLHMNDTEPESFSIQNSFSMLPEEG
jgi:hypothetical protein